MSTHADELSMESTSLVDNPMSHTDTKAKDVPTSTEKLSMESTSTGENPTSSASAHAENEVKDSSTSTEKLSMESVSTGHLPISNADNKAKESSTSAENLSTESTFTGHLPISNTDNKAKELSTSAENLSTESTFTGHLPISNTDNKAKELSTSTENLSTESTFIGHDLMSDAANELSTSTENLNMESVPTVHNPLSLAEEEAKQFIYTHRVFVTIIQESNNINLGTIHHWNHSDPGKSTFIPITIPPVPRTDPNGSGPLKCVSGFQSHGPVFISWEQSTRRQLHMMLTKYMQVIKGRKDAGDDGCMITELINHIDTSHGLRLADQPRRYICRLYSMSVSSCTKDALMGDGQDIWKWVKPVGEYGKHGFWTPNFDETMVNGEWMAGMGLKLMVAGLSKEHMKDMFEDGNRFSAIPEALR